MQSESDLLSLMNCTYHVFIFLTRVGEYAIDSVCLSLCLC